MSKVLVVDDEQILRDAYALIIKSGGYEVITAFDGVDALEKISQEKPSLVLLDMVMPNLDGLGVLEQLKLPKHYPKLKIVIFSNLPTQDKINKALELGAVKHFVKASLTPQQVMAEVRDLLAAP